MNRMRRLLSVLALLLLMLAAASPAAADAVVVNGTEVKASRNGDELAAVVVLLNVSDADQSLSAEAVTPKDCVSKVEPSNLKRGQSTKVTLSLRPVCFAQEATVDLDGSGPLPAITVSPSTSTPDWKLTCCGVLAGLILGGVVAHGGVTAQREAKKKLETPAELVRLEAEYAGIKSIVDARVSELDRPVLQWKKLDPSYGYRSVLIGLKAAWSFKDSWVANFTVASSAFVALVSSTDVLEFLLGEEPTGAVGMMTLFSLTSAALIGVANTLVKIIGPSVDRVTITGLTASTALVAFAAGLQVGIVAAVAVDALGLSTPSVIVGILAAAVCLALVAYARRSLTSAISDGVSGKVPSIPDDALDAWAADTDWERSLVHRRLLQTYGDWLEDAVSGDATGPQPSFIPLPPPPPDTRRAALV